MTALESGVSFMQTTKQYEIQLTDTEDNEIAIKTVPGEDDLYGFFVEEEPIFKFSAEEVPDLVEAIQSVVSGPVQSRVTKVISSS